MTQVTNEQLIQAGFITGGQLQGTTFGNYEKLIHGQ